MKATSTKTNQNAHTAANLHTNIGTVMNTMIKHLALSLTALVCATGVTAALADKIDASKVTTFSAGAPARAAEVNSTIAELTSAIDDNDQRIAQLLATPAAPPAITLNVDCSADPAALNSAINNASLQTSLKINVSGACSAVSITRDHVGVDGGADGASITSTAVETPALRVKQARGINLQNLTLSGSDVAEYGLEITFGSALKASNLTISGATNSAVETTINSSLLLSGDNVISGGQALGLYAAAASTIYISDGTTTIASDGCTLETELGGYLVSEGRLTATGSCLFVNENSHITVEHGTITTDTATVVGTLALSSAGVDTSVTLNFNNEALVYGGGTLFATAQNGGTLTLAGTTEEAQLTVAGNATASFLTGGDQNSTVSLTGNVVVVDGYFTATSGSAFGRNNPLGFNHNITLGTGEDWLFARNSYITLSGNNDDNNNNAANFNFATAELHASSFLGFFVGSATPSDTVYSINRNSELRTWGPDLQVEGNTFNCFGDGYASSLVNGNFTELCPTQ